MKAKVDHDLCTGCGICEEKCPAVFVIKDGLAYVKTEEPVPTEHKDDCRSACDNCPVEAIELEE